VKTVNSVVVKTRRLNVQALDPDKVRFSAAGPSIDYIETEVPVMVDRDELIAALEAELDVTIIEHRYLPKLTQGLFGDIDVKFSGPDNHESWSFSGSDFTEEFARDGIFAHVALARHLIQQEQLKLKAKEDEKVTRFAQAYADIYQDGQVDDATLDLARKMVAAGAVIKEKK
jgi:hypothetical protein